MDYHSVLTHLREQSSSESCDAWDLTALNSVLPTYFDAVHATIGSKERRGNTPRLVIAEEIWMKQLELVVLDASWLWALLQLES